MANCIRDVLKTQNFQSLQFKFFVYCLFSHFSINFTYLFLIKQTTKLEGLSKYRKGDFTSSVVAIYQKSIFRCLNLSENISGYLNLWHIFRFIVTQLRMTFFIKLRWQKKIIFLQMHKTIFQK